MIGTINLYTESHWACRAGVLEIDIVVVRTEAGLSMWRDARFGGTPDLEGRRIFYALHSK